jgi:hypothetical protein
MTIGRTAIVNDSGAGTDGTVLDNAWKAELYDQIDANAATAVQADAATGTANDFALTSGGTSTLRCTNATLRTYTGFVAGAAGQRIRVIATVGQVDFANQAAGSAAANRLINNVTGTISIVAGGSVTYEYDVTTARWRVVDHKQGGRIQMAYAGGNFTAASGTWTVDAGDQAEYGYLLDAVNKQMTVTFNVATTSVSATPISLNAVIPGGFTSPAQQDLATYFLSEGGTYALGLFVRIAAGTTMQFFKNALANWATATNTTSVAGRFTFEVS